MNEGKSMTFFGDTETFKTVLAIIRPFPAPRTTETRIPDVTTRMLVFRKLRPSLDDGRHRRPSRPPKRLKGKVVFRHPQ